MEKKIYTNIINNINFNIPLKQIFTRLGYSKTTKILDVQKKKILKNINDSIVYCQTEGIYKRFKINKKNDLIELENGLFFKSISLNKFLDKAFEIFLIGVTIGKKIIEFRDDYIKNNDLTFAIIADAVGSEYVEAAAEWMHSFLNNSLIKEGLFTTKNRFSPGYGDLSLESHKIFFDSLELNKINMSLSENYILIPEKSITAIIGIIERN